MVVVGVVIASVNQSSREASRRAQWPPHARRPASSVRRVEERLTRAAGLRRRDATRGPLSDLIAPDLTGGGGALPFGYHRTMAATTIMIIATRAPRLRRWCCSILQRHARVSQRRDVRRLVRIPDGHFALEFSVGPATREARRRKLCASISQQMAPVSVAPLCCHGWPQQQPRRSVWPVWRRRRSSHPVLAVIWRRLAQKAAASQRQWQWQWLGQCWWQRWRQCR